MRKNTAIKQQRSTTMRQFSKILDTYIQKDFAILDSEYDRGSFYSPHPRMNDGLIIALIEKGSGFILLNFKKIEIQENMVVVIHPHSIIEIQEKSDDISVKAFFLSFSLMTEFKFLNNFEAIFKIRQQPCQFLSEETMHELIEFYSFIAKQIYSIGYPYQKEMAVNLFSALILKIQSVLHIKTPHKEETALSRNELITDRFLHLVIKHYKEEKFIVFYSNKLCLSPKHLSSIIKKVLGKPMHFWINEMVVMAAKFQLKTTNLTVKEIAGEFNFSNPSLFGRFFKEQTGCTPNEYRRK